MNDIIKKVEEFHRLFSISISDKPTLLEDSKCLLRHKLMREENEEYLEACDKKDLVEVADALGDQLYILCGTILSHGLQHIIVDVFNEIHKSNMSKLGEDGKPLINGININDPSKPMGKVLKGPGYFRPNIVNIMNNEQVGSNLQ